MSYTYPKIKKELLNCLGLLGWDIKRKNSNNFKPLKVPHATKGDVRLYFKAQSVYKSDTLPHTLNNAYSVWTDTKSTCIAELVIWLNTLSN